MDLIGSYSSEENHIIEHFSDDNNEIVVIRNFFNSEDMDDAECTRYDFVCTVRYYFHVKVISHGINANSESAK